LSKPTDAGSKHVYLEFYLEDNSVLSSRDINFHDIALNSITKIVLHTKYATHTLDKAQLPAEFKEFIHFRSAGVLMLLEDEEWIPHRIYTWTIGWTDGQTEYLQEYKYKGGELVRTYEVPRDLVYQRSHYHPDNLELQQWKAENEEE
jgi:hypothetical protein